jgi:hypothetical protein
MVLLGTSWYFWVQHGTFRYHRGILDTMVVLLGYHGSTFGNYVGTLVNYGCTFWCHWVLLGTMGYFWVHGGTFGYHRGTFCYLCGTFSYHLGKSGAVKMQSNDIKFLGLSQKYI